MSIGVCTSPADALDTRAAVGGDAIVVGGTRGGGRSRARGFKAGVDGRTLLSEGAVVIVKTFDAEVVFGTAFVAACPAFGTAGSIGTAPAVRLASIATLGGDDTRVVDALKTGLAVGVVDASKALVAGADGLVGIGAVSRIGGGFEKTASDALVGSAERFGGVEVLAGGARNALVALFVASDTSVIRAEGFVGGAVGGISGQGFKAAFDTIAVGAMAGGGGGALGVVGGEVDGVAAGAFVGDAVGEARAVVAVGVIGAFDAVVAGAERLGRGVGGAGRARKRGRGVV